MSEEQEQRPRGEKQEEKEEKSWEEKWRRDPLNAAVWAIILIWGGVMLLAHNFNLLAWFPFLDAWGVFFIGAGCILLLEVGFRLIMPAYRQPVLGNIILAIVFLAIGLGNLDFIGWECILPLAVIGAGLFLLVRGLLRRPE
jgi:hypothetical protein